MPVLFLPRLEQALSVMLFPTICFVVGAEARFLAGTIQERQ
jgi:hypothetical protein